MSTADAQVERPEHLDALPAFDLRYAVDDPDAPTSVTVFDPLADDPTTAWLTADVPWVVDLRDVA